MGIKSKIGMKLCVESYLNTWLPEWILKRLYSIGFDLVYPQGYGDWKCPHCGKPLRQTDCGWETYQCDECMLAWRIYDVHPMTQGDKILIF